MKSVTCSEVMRVHGGARFQYAGASLRQAMLFGLTLAFGVPALIVTFHLLDPGAPLGYIVLPVLAGSLAPVIAMLPGRFEVQTRFPAQHLAGTLDETLAALGYAQAQQFPGTLRYRVRQAGWQPWGAREIAVSFRDHVLEITGPYATLTALKKQMAY
ncbi:MAG: hypothetical protein ACJ8LG_05715 [Massilia sp.]